MSERPLIIKCNFYNIKPEELAEIRENIRKQMEDDVPVVMLPCGFELAKVDVELLEKIKAEINQYGSIMAEWNDNMTKEEIVESVLKQAKECVLFVLDNHIKELKGENK